ncbi:putative phage holin [Brachybacterium conglomeratum]|uniref:putative phage holin n=1 Tax=Brachybacterium conglomeratum TaxID=47846 RepID=UPI003DA00419
MTIYTAILLYTSIIPVGLFVFYCGTRSKWWATPLGRVIMGLLLSILAVLTIGLVARVFDPEWLNLVRFFVYGAMNVGLWHFLWVLRVTQRTRCDGTKEPTDVQKAWRFVTGPLRRKCD